MAEKQKLGRSPLEIVRNGPRVLDLRQAMKKRDQELARRYRGIPTADPEHEPLPDVPGELPKK